jgi:hypothetical protein
MPMTTEVYMALLAMDSYNRGYGQSLDVVANGASTTQIGNANVEISSNTIPASSEVAAGFFAQSYTLNGQKIIAYRGTDDEFHLKSLIRITVTVHSIHADFWLSLSGMGLLFMNGDGLETESSYEEMKPSVAELPSPASSIP